MTGLFIRPDEQNYTLFGWKMLLSMKPGVDRVYFYT